MKITKDGHTITISARGPGLKLKDVQPGDVFRFANGAPINLYVMGQDDSYFFMTGSEEFPKHGSSRNARVIVYPNAALDLGDACHTHEQMEAASNMIEVPLGQQLTATRTPVSG